MERNIQSEVFTAVALGLTLLAVGLSALVLSSINNAPATALTQTATPREVISNVGDTQTENSPTVSPTMLTSNSVTQRPSHTPLPTDTATPLPTDTATPLPTDTAIPLPTERPTQRNFFSFTGRTRTPTLTASPTALTTTLTASPTVTIASSPTLTPIVTATSGSTPTAEPCTQPTGWTTYEVVPGNTLFSIARAVGSTVSELRQVNCIANADNIGVGSIIFVPRQPQRPVQTGVPSLPKDTTQLTLQRRGCTVPASSIVEPVPGQRISGVFSVRGTGALDEFQFYRLEVRPDYTSIYNFWSRSDQPVYNGTLGQINAEIFDDGLYWVRLTVVDNTGNFIEPCEVPVIFD